MAEPEAEDPSTVCSGLSYESRSLAQSTFSFPGETDLDVSMWRGLPGRPHPTWHCPTSKRACLENLIFLPTDAEFQSRCLRHVCSVCVVLWLGWKQSTECGESVWKALLHAWLFEHVCFIPGTWLVSVKLPRWGLEDFSRFPLVFQGKQSWISEQDYSISGGFNGDSNLNFHQHKNKLGGLITHADSQATRRSGVQPQNQHF